MLGSALSKIGREAVRIVLPSWCVVCDGELPWRDRVGSCCRMCWSDLPRINTSKCVSCALPLQDVGEVPSTPLRASAGVPLSCIECQLDPLPVDWCDAWGHYRGSLERLLHAFKFGRHDFLDDALASLVEETLRTRGDLSFDAIVPVPMHRNKLRRRGYNQAELLARALGRRIGVRCEPALLAKRIERESQSTLPRKERAANVRGAFAALKARSKSILVVDDVCTTGETLRACAAELLRSGASRVCAITVAKAGN